MSKLNFQQKLVLQTHHGVMLCSGTTPEGEPFFHYVMADAKNIDKMYRDYETGTDVDFASYGEVLLSGWGEKPSEEYEQILVEYFKED